MAVTSSPPLGPLGPLAPLSSLFSWRKQRGGSGVNNHDLGHNQLPHNHHQLPKTPQGELGVRRLTKEEAKVARMEAEETVWTMTIVLIVIIILILRHCSV